MTSEQRPTEDEVDPPAAEPGTEPATNAVVKKKKKKKKKKPASAPVVLAPEPAERPSRTPGRPVVPPVVPPVVLAAAAVVFGVLWVQARGTAGDRLEAARSTSAQRSRVLATAQKVAIDFSSYDYRRLDANFDRVAGQLTGGFAKSYRATSGSLKATLSQYQAVGTAKVLDAGVSTLGPDRAVVVVFLDQTVTSKVSKTPTVDRNRVRVTLQRSGERWLVSALDLR